MQKIKNTKPKIAMQIGCGYCAFETVCPIHNPKKNKAKKGCNGFLHFEKTKI